MVNIVRFHVLDRFIFPVHSFNLARIPAPVESFRNSIYTPRNLHGLWLISDNVSKELWQQQLIKALF